MGFDEYTSVCQSTPFGNEVADAEARSMFGVRKNVPPLDETINDGRAKMSYVIGIRISSRIRFLYVISSLGVVLKLRISESAFRIAAPLASTPFAFKISNVSRFVPAFLRAAAESRALELPQPYRHGK